LRFVVPDSHRSVKERALKNPDHEVRRSIIREWMKLPKDKRRSKEQALSFATQVSERSTLKGPGDSSARVMGWLLPRVGRN
jgi:hypothetical protein